jgi:hypothetical protein
MSRIVDLEEMTKIKTGIAGGASFREVARGIGRSPSTVHAIANKPEIAEEIQALRLEIAGDFEKLAKRALTNVTDKKLKTTSAYQSVLIAGIAAQRSTELRYDGNKKIAPTINIRIMDPTNKSIQIESEGEVIEITGIEREDTPF